MELAHEVEVDDNGTMNVEGKGRVVGPILFFLMLSIIFRIYSFCWGPYTLLLILWSEQTWSCPPLYNWLFFPQIVQDSSNNNTLFTDKSFSFIFQTDYLSPTTLVQPTHGLYEIPPKFFKLLCLKDLLNAQEKDRFLLSKLCCGSSDNAPLRYRG